jgi:hypothetical protein
MGSAAEKPTCACGSQTLERVVVTRPDAEPYVTELVACAHCRVMYHRPRPVARPPHPVEPEIDDWAARYRKSVRK